MKIFRKNFDMKTGNPGIRKDAEKFCIYTGRQEILNKKTCKITGFIQTGSQESLKREKV